MQKAYQAADMDEFQNEIERAARRVFRLFFGSRLYRRKRPGEKGRNFIGVEMQVQYQGDKRLSIFMEREGVASIGEILGAGRDSGCAGHDILGEMANIIAGSALRADSGEANISPPERAEDPGDRSLACALQFSSKMGMLCIAVEER